jgi:predicted DNA-binding protein YlxM (UPF0122 family)
MLSDAQYNDLDSYYNQDLSLSEIADNVGKSRQGVFESIKRAEFILTDMESKLGFLNKANIVRNDFNLIEEIAKAAESELFKSSDCSAQKQRLKSILKITAKYKGE